jgi:hydroxymethylpyrimidine/phosphomethylpyrimidine kinase
VTDPAIALSIAGSDPSGGAGIQGDLKTFQAHGVHGMAVVTALTVQSTRGVGAVHPVAPDVVSAQILALLDDLPPAAVKVGMLGDAGVVRAVAAALRGVRVPIVVDPVLISSSGRRLLAPDAERALVDELLPLATLVTPNLPEAAALFGEDAALLGDDVAGWSARVGVAVLLKDGHGDDALARDRLLLPDGSSVVSAHPRIQSRNTHGTGCALSSAIAARLARGEALAPAVAGAVAWLGQVLADSAHHGLGQGTGPLLISPPTPHY